jgi:hypothetical protein
MIEKNLFRALPLVSFFAALLAMLHFFPDLANGLVHYLHERDLEDSQGYKSLYVIVTPVAIAYFLTWQLLLKDKIEWTTLFFLLLVLALFPLAIGLSQWLWNFLGWALMGVFLFGAIGCLLEVEDKNDPRLITMILIFLAYLGFRIFAEYKAIYDILLVGLYGTALLSDTIITLFIATKTDSKNPKIVFYCSVPLLLFVFFVSLAIVSFV